MTALFHLKVIPPELHKNISTNVAVYMFVSNYLHVPPSLHLLPSRAFRHMASFLPEKEKKIERISLSLSGGWKPAASPAQLKQAKEK